MNESRPSKAQEAFLKAEKRHHILVGSARFLVFFLFAGLWEISADLGLIDAFIFSSPSRMLPLLLHHGHGQKYFSPYWDYVI